MNKNEFNRRLGWILAATLLLVGATSTTRFHELIVMSDATIFGEHTFHGGAFIDYEGTAQPGTGGNTDWHKFTGCTASPDLDGVTHSDCDLTVVNAGHYDVTYTASSTGQTGDVYLTALSVGNPPDLVPETGIGCNSARTKGAGTDVGDYSGSCSSLVAAGDTVRVLIKSDGGGPTEATIKAFNWSVKQN